MPENAGIILTFPGTMRRPPILNWQRDGLKDLPLGERVRCAEMGRTHLKPRLYSVKVHPVVSGGPVSSYDPQAGWRANTAREEDGLLPPTVDIAVNNVAVKVCTKKDIRTLFNNLKKNRAELFLSLSDAYMLRWVFGKDLSIFDYVTIVDKLKVAHVDTWAEHLNAGALRMKLKRIMQLIHRDSGALNIKELQKEVDFYTRQRHKRNMELGDFLVEGKPPTSDLQNRGLTTSFLVGGAVGAAATYITMKKFNKTQQLVTDKFSSFVGGVLDKITELASSVGLPCRLLGVVAIALVATALADRVPSMLCTIILSSVAIMAVRRGLSVKGVDISIFKNSLISCAKTGSYLMTVAISFMGMLAYGSLAGMEKAGSLVTKLTKYSALFVAAERLSDTTDVLFDFTSDTLREWAYKIMPDYAYDLLEKPHLALKELRAAGRNADGSVLIAMDFMRDDANAQYFVDVYEKAVDVYDKAMEHRVRTKIVTELKKEIDSSRNLYKTARTALGCDDVIVTPHVVYLYGKPGLFKSTVLSHVAQKLIPDTRVYTRDILDQYWSGYNPSKDKCVVFDDFMAFNAPNANEGAEFMSIVTNNAKVLNMPSVDDVDIGIKGTRFRSPLVLVASNQKDPQIPFQTEPEAFRRRRHSFWEVVPRAGVPTRGDGSDIIAEEVNLTTCMCGPDCRIHEKKNLYEASLAFYRLASNTGERISNPMTYSEFKEKCNTLFKAHYDREIERLNVGKKIMKADLENRSDSARQMLEELDVSGCVVTVAEHYKVFAPVVQSNQYNLISDTLKHVCRDTGRSELVHGTPRPIVKVHVQDEAKEGNIEAVMVPINVPLVLASDNEMEDEGIDVGPMGEMVRLSEVTTDLLWGMDRKGFRLSMQMLYRLQEGAVAYDRRGDRPILIDDTKRFSRSEMIFMAGIQEVVGWFMILGAVWALFKTLSGVVHWMRGSSHDLEARGDVSGSGLHTKVGKQHKIHTHRLHRDLQNRGFPNSVGKIADAMVDFEVETVFGTSKMRGLMIRGRRMLMPAHALLDVRALGHPIEVTFRVKGNNLFTTTSDTRTVTFTVLGTDVRVPWCDEQKSYGDAAVVILPSNVRPFPDLTRFFYTIEEMNDLTVNLPSVVNVAKMKNSVVLSDGVAEFNSIPKTTTSGITLFQSWVVRHLLNLGDCGQPLLTNAGKVLGIAVAGSWVEDQAHYFPVTKQLVELLVGGEEVAFEEMVGDPSLIMEGFSVVSNTESTHVTTKSQLKRTSLSKEVMEEVLECQLPELQISVMDKSDPRFEPKPNGPTPLKNAIQKYAGESVEMDENVLRSVAAIYSSDIHLAGEQRILTTKEAIQGVPGLVDPINFTTSPGLPYVNVGMKKIDCVGPDGDICGLARERYEDRFEKAKNGIITKDSVWKDFPKDEVLPKVKTRHITVPPFDYQVLCRQYFGTAAAEFRKFRYQNGSAIGVDAESPQWDELARYLQGRSTGFIDVDYKNFDGSIPAVILRVAGDVLSTMYKDKDPENNVIRGVLIEEAIFTIAQCENIKYQKTHGNPSGNPLTDVLNTIANNLLVRYAYIKSGRKNFDANQTMIAYGDDLVLGESAPGKGITFEELKSQLTRLGMTITPADKSDVSKGYRPLSEISFLKRRFVVSDAFQGLIVPQIEKATLGKILLFCKKDERAENLFKMRARAVVAFSIFYGEDFYEKVASLCKWYAATYQKTTLVLPTYESLVAAYWLSQLDEYTTMVV
ncbi:hypothetical protein 1 [Beihai picorna-like virus 124]|uniref:hypothetical protein 1 n=1 Tax=Beihai picorna-like virus 124 TaxID=1922553 RepID=UPI00090CCAF9|nr:hypothetical protein 1 [Beihai picorna-like virus 124]APG76726.1 hypothetical protein 1 [Beihai picorna-like virus 124]